jgi:CubicO group peptidase (beta-lactamase class C family)
MIQLKQLIQATLVAVLPVGAFLFTSCDTKLASDDLLLTAPHTVDSIIDSFVDNGSYPFVYARLEDKNGNILYEHGKVNSDLLPGVEVDGDTWIRIWSMSKIVTISTALDLVEEGLLSLDDPVSEFIPEFSDLKVAVSPDGTPLTEVGEGEPACPIKLVPMDSVMTVLHLIDHKAGFYYSTTGINCLDSMMAVKDFPAAADSDDLIRRMASLPLIQQSGTKYFYGTNTTVLGLVMERATGKDLQQIVRERVLEPAGIEGLQYDLPEGEALIPRVSGRDTVLRLAHPGELDIFSSSVPDYDPDHALYLGGEGMIATSDGYTDFLRLLLNRGALNGARILDSATVKDIHSPHTLLDNPYGYNGYNLWVSSDSMRVQGTGDGGLWIGGGYEGTHFWIDPHREFVGVIMTQIFWVPPAGYGRDDVIRGEIYRQLFESEKNDI